ncbi:hypothetical protein J3A83DRAFT_3809189 [Scleroderma citrinum]
MTMVNIGDQHALHAPTAFPRSHFPSIHFSTNTLPTQGEGHAMSLRPFSLPTPAPTPTPTATTSTTPAESAESSPPPFSQPSTVGSAVHPPTICFSPATPSADTPPAHANDFGFQDPERQEEAPPIGAHFHEHQHPQHAQASEHKTRNTLTVGDSGLMENKTCVPSSMSGPVGRRQRFTMGPRADCIKCRMGVKGHWVHLD